MVTFERWFTQDLNKPILPQHGQGLVFTGDDGTPLVGVHVTRNGAPADLSGTVSCTVMRADGTTVPVTGGTISGGDVSVVLSSACFNIRGPIGVALAVTSGSTTMTVLKAMFQVDITSTGNIIDPSGEITLDVANLIADIDAAVASIPADYSDLLAAIAPTFITSKEYAAGAYVWNNGKLYRFTVAHAAGAWTGTDAAQVPLAGDVADLKSAISDLHDVTFELGDGLISEVQTVITNLTTHSGYRYGADGDLVEVSLTVGVAEAVEIPVVPGQKIRWTCYQANANSAWNVKYLMRDGSVVADTNYTDAGEYTFTVPLNCDKLLVSCWVVNGENIFYLYGYEGTPAKQYVDELIADVDNSIDDIQSTLTLLGNPKDNYALIYTNNRPDNFIDQNLLIDGFYINASGVPTASNDWCCTDFIDVSGITTIYGKNIGFGAWYNSSKTFISGVTLGNSSANPPSNAKYIRVSILPANKATAIICPHNFHRDFAADSPTSWWVTPKKGYESGYIRFTVPVNNTVATYSDTTETNHEGTPDYVNVDCVLSLPYKYKPVGKPCKLIMMCHGAGKGVSGTDNWTDNSSYNTLVSMFTSYGYAVFDCNGFKNDALGWSFWGNQRGLEAWRKAYLYVTDNYNVEKTLAIYAFSMGGLTAMNLAFQGFPNINAIALGSPVLNLRKVWDSTDGTKAVLQTLYGLGDTWDESKVVGDNPYKHIMTLDDTAYCPYRLPPIKIWYGSTETNNSGNPAIEKEDARAFVDAITNSGGYAYYREVSGRGHEICYGGSSVVNQEILYYLERYERAVTEFH